MSARRGTVYLVGAGPGDPGLITVRGLDLLMNADVIVYDRLVDSRLLDRASEFAELIDVGKSRGDAAVGQDEINDILVDRAQSGALVVRLKGGDPFLFGRGGEEALALAEAGIPFEVVPGVTSALAAPAYAGIPVTHRGAASLVTIATGAGASGGEASPIAPGEGTVVVLMGWENIETIVADLVREGRSPETPAAVVRWGTEPFQQTVTGTLADIVDRASAADLGPPVVIVVGEVVRLREQMRWFDNRPLYGKRVLVTRARAQAGRLSEMLYREGALPLEAPAIRIEPLPDYSDLDDRLLHLDEVDWVVFASANAVAAVFARMDALGLDARDFHSANVAAIGSETAASLRRRGIMADFVPERFVSESALEGLREFGMGGARVLYPRSQTGMETLPAGLAEMGAEVDEVPAYVTVTAHDSAPMVAEILSQGVDAAVFTSSSTVKGLLALLDGDPARLEGAVIACVGPITAGTATDNGLEVDIVAEPHTIPGLVAALRAYYSKEDPS